jgi:hypothetical protein
MTESAVALGLRSLLSANSFVFDTTKGMQPSSRDNAQEQGQSWFYVDDNQGNRHRIIVEEAEND